MSETKQVLDHDAGRRNKTRVDHVLDMQTNTVMLPWFLADEGVGWKISASGFPISQTVEATPRTKAGSAKSVEKGREGTVTRHRRLCYAMDCDDSRGGHGKHTSYHP